MAHSRPGLLHAAGARMKRSRRCDAVHAQPPVQLAAGLQQPQRIGIGKERHFGKALGVEEARAAREARVARVVDDIQGARRQFEAHLRDDRRATASTSPSPSGNLPEQRLAPARLQGEFELRCRGLDDRNRRQARPRPPRRCRLPPAAAWRSRRASSARHGHQNADRRAMPGSSAASFGRVSTAMPAGGMPR